MKTKLFLAFVAVISAALLSNFIFERLIMKDFDDYVAEVKEDQFRWILSSIEESYNGERWDRKALSESLHWAMMLGLHVKVIDAGGKEVISSEEVMESLSDTMHHRMEGLFPMSDRERPFDEHPLLVRGKKIGTLLSHSFTKRELKEKESIFKGRTANFLTSTLVIAGGGLLVMALLLSQYLSKPVTRLKEAAEKVAKGDFTVRVSSGSRDEVGALSEGFNRMVESLEREEDFRRRLMSNIAHELRTPLTIMKAHLEAIADGVIEREQGLENIHSELEKFIDLVKGIEDITAAEASFFAQSRRVEINLGEFLSGLVREMLPLFSEKGLSLELRGSGDVTVHADDEKLEKIIRNILANSLKFTEQGGAVIDFAAEGHAVSIEVRDTGRGIPASDLPHIFERFYRGGTSQTAGLGLGLAIARELVTVMGGTIDVESTVDLGTTFRVSLPYQKG